MTEKELQKKCENYLNKLDIKYISRYNENMLKRNIGIRKDLKGVPDLVILCHYGQMVFIELKTEKAFKMPNHNRSEDQLEWANYLMKNGHDYCCLCDFKVFKEIIDLYK